MTAEGSPPNRVPSTVITGVIVLFTADETLLSVIVWILACLGGAVLIASQMRASLRRFLNGPVLSRSALLQEMTNEQLSLEGLLPALCPVRSVSDRTEPPDRIRHRAENGLRGWQTDGR